MSDRFVPPADSPLRREIATALKSRGRRAAGILVSVTRRAEWFQPPDGGSKVWVKWLCWNLTSKNGYNVTKPALRFVHGELSQASLEKALDHWFPGYRCVVDNDINIRE